MRNRLRRNKADFEGVGSNRNSHPSDREPVGCQVFSQVELDNVEFEIAAFEGGDRDELLSWINNYPPLIAVT